MNKTNFNQTGGFPLKTERLKELETSYLILQAFGNIAGNLTIISGCEVVGTTIADGVVFIDGEVLEFRTAVAPVDSTVIIIEENIDRAFENGTVKTVHTKRYATIGTNPEVSWLWSDFKRPLETKNLDTRLAAIEKKLTIFQPGGVVFPWFKPVAEIPAGFQEVADMKGRTIIGYDPTQTEFNLIGKKGGAKSVSSTSAVPITGYSGTESTDGGTSGKLIISSGQNEEGEYLDSLRKAGTAPNITINTSTLSPYKIAAYIEYIG